MSIAKQALSTLLACFLMMNMGLMYAWPSSTVQNFSSNETILNRPMTETEQSLFGSLFSVVALISTPISGFLLELVGRKKSCILFALPQIIAWAILCITRKVEIVLIAICISGMSTGLFTVVPLYISEICQEDIRGTMTAGANIFWGVGVMLSYILGCLSYDAMNYGNLAISVAGAVLMMYLKESPVYSMSKGLDRDAAKAIAFYRNIALDSKEIDQELAVIRRTLNPQLDGSSPEEEKLNAQKETKEKVSLLQFFRKSRSTRRALFLVCALTFCSVFQGVVVVQVYAKPMFEAMLPSIPGNITGIVFAILSTLVGFLAAYFLDLFGRRALVIYPSIAGCLSCLAIGSQIQFQWAPNWLTGIFIVTYCIAYTFGGGTVPYVVIAEIFLPEIRSALTMVTLEWAWICNFLILFIYNPLLSLLGLGGVFYIFAASCLLTAILCHFRLPETKALTVDVIQTLL